MINPTAAAKLYDTHCFRNQYVVGGLDRMKYVSLRCGPLCRNVNRPKTAQLSSGHRQLVAAEIYIFSVGSPEGSDAHAISLLVTGGHKLIIVNWHYTPSLSKHT